MSKTEAKAEKPKLNIEAVIERLKKYAQPIREFLDAIEGRRDIKGRVDVLANPTNPKSMSILSPQKMKFCVNSYWAAGKWGGIFDGLQELAKENMEFSPSGNQGIGREQVIRFIGATEEAKASRISILTDAAKKAAEGETEKQ